MEGEICIRMHHGHPPGLFIGYYAIRRKNDRCSITIFTTPAIWPGVTWKIHYFIGRGDDVIKSSGYRMAV